MNIVFLDAMTLGKSDLSAIDRVGNLTLYPFSTPEECVERAKLAEIVITNKVVLNRKILQKLPKLRLICIAATGMNNIDLDAAKEFNIAVKNVAGYSTASVAQHTIMLALGLLGHTSYYDSYIKSGRYSKSPVFVNLDHDPIDIEGKNWGIIGMGSIGRKVAGIAQALGANVSYYLREGGKVYPFLSQNLHDLLRNCHIVSIHAPLNAQTQGMIGANELELLQDSSILLNLGRGGIVDEVALANALKKRPLYAGLDVFETEPLPKNNPLLSSEIPSERLLLTPHIAWGYEQSRKRLIAGIVENIKSLT